MAKFCMLQLIAEDLMSDRKDGELMEYQFNRKEQDN